MHKLDHSWPIYSKKTVFDRTNCDPLKYSITILAILGLGVARSLRYDSEQLWEHLKVSGLEAIYTHSNLSAYFGVEGCICNLLRH